MRDLNGKNAVVVAAASGIGEGIAFALARAGANLGLIDISAERLAATQAGAARRGAPNVVCEVADVSDRAGITTAADRIRAQLGDVQVVCSNAGVGLRGDISTMADENFDWLVAVNFVGSYNVIKAFVPQMVASGLPGNYLITASVVSLFELPAHQSSVYTATKMALLGLATSLRAELAPHEIAVGVLMPGLVNTNTRQGGQYRQPRFGGPFQRPDRARNPDGMSPEDIGRVVLRAIEDDAFYIQSHPHAARSGVVERTERILSSCDHWERVLPELGVRVDYPAF